MTYGNHLFATKNIVTNTLAFMRIAERSGKRSLF